MRISTLSLTAITLLCLSALSLVQSWTTFPQSITRPRHTRPSSCPPLSAGFGASNDNKKEGKTAAPLKPKQQWDRYLALKQAPRVMVGVQIQDTDDWLPVGSVKAKEAAALEAAVLRQRALIAEVRSLFSNSYVSKRCTEYQWGPNRKFSLFLWLVFDCSTPSVSFLYRSLPNQSWRGEWWW